MLERRRDPRTQSYVPITLQADGAEAGTPAHLLDLSCGGAGILSTSYNAPALGDCVELTFETFNSDGGTESTGRRETGIVANISTPERGVSRIGIRFLQHPDVNCGLFDPLETLSTHRKRIPPEKLSSRWETARFFDKTTAAGAAT